LANGRAFIAQLYETPNVRFWHKADMRTHSADVRFWG
jgi:hypothetical protein